MQVDHRVPIYYGGPNTISNFILACQQCNSFKAQHVLLRKRDRMAYVLENSKVIRLQAPNYARQEKAYALAFNDIMDEEFARAMIADRS